LIFTPADFIGCINPIFKPQVRSISTLFLHL
jgi:hypothetical protein